MDTPNRQDALKFNLAFSPYADIPTRGEWLWGRWLDRKKGLVLVANNAFQVPLVVNDVVRVARDPGGRWRAMELVRVTESVVSFTCWGDPISDATALATYDGWREQGHSIHTEGCQEMMTTAWREFLTLEEVLGITTPVLSQPGWQLWGLYRPEERRADIEQCVRFGFPGQPVTGTRKRR